MSFRGSTSTASPGRHAGMPSPFMAPQGGSMGAQAPPMAYSQVLAPPMTAPTMGRQNLIMGHPPMGQYPLASTSPTSGTPTLRGQAGPQLIRNSPGPQAPPATQLQRSYSDVQPQSAMPLMSSPGLQAMMGNTNTARLQYQQYGSISPAHGPYLGSHPPSMPPMQTPAMQAVSAASPGVQLQMQRSPPSSANSLKRSPSGSSTRMAPSPRTQPQMQLAYAQQPPRSQSSKWQVARAGLIGGNQSGSLGSLSLHHQAQVAPSQPMSKPKSLNSPASPLVGSHVAQANDKAAKSVSAKKVKDEPAIVFQKQERGKAQRSAPGSTRRPQPSGLPSKFSIVNGDGSNALVENHEEEQIQGDEELSDTDAPGVVQEGSDAWGASANAMGSDNWAPNQSGSSQGNTWGITPFYPDAATYGSDLSYDKENMNGYGIAFVGRHDAFGQAVQSRNILNPLYATNGSRYSTTSTASVLGSWAKSSNLSTKSSLTVGDLWGFDGASQQWRRRRFTLKGSHLHYDKGNEDRQVLGGIVLASSSVVETCLEDHFDRPFCFTIETMAPGGEGVQKHLFAADNDRARVYWIDKLADAGCNVEAGEAMDTLTKFFFPMFFEAGAGRTKAKTLRDSWDSVASGSDPSFARSSRAPIYNPNLRASTGSSTIFGI